MLFQSEQGTLDTDTWSGLRGSVSMVSSTEPALQWWQAAAPMFNPNIRAFVEQEVYHRKDDAP